MGIVIYKPAWSFSNYLITLKRKEDILIGVSDFTEYRSDWRSLHSDTKEELKLSVVLKALYNNNKKMWINLWETLDGIPLVFEHRRCRGVFFDPFRSDLYQPSCTFIASITLQYIIVEVEIKFHFQFRNDSEIIWKNKNKTLFAVHNNRNMTDDPEIIVNCLRLEHFVPK